MKHLIISYPAIAAGILAIGCITACRPANLISHPVIPDGYYTEITLKATEHGLPSPITISPADVVLPDKPVFYSINSMGTGIKIKGMSRNISWIITHYNVSAVSGKAIRHPYDMHKCCCFEVYMSELVDVCF